MTQEEKRILLIDLCGRIPYNTKLKAIDSPDIDFYLYSISSTDIVATTAKGGFICMSIEGFKPYLFPLSSMTSEHIYEINNMLGEDFEFDKYGIAGRPLSYSELNALFEYFNKNHFDYRGLIPKGLAINATNLNIY